MTWQILVCLVMRGGGRACDGGGSSLGCGSAPAARTCWTVCTCGDDVKGSKNVA